MGADFVLYWMTATRRLSWNYALDRAVDWALELDLPLVILSHSGRGTVGPVIATISLSLMEWRTTLVAWRLRL